MIDRAHIAKAARDAGITEARANLFLSGLLDLGYCIEPLPRRFGFDPGMRTQRARTAPSAPAGATDWQTGGPGAAWELIVTGEEIIGGAGRQHWPKGVKAGPSYKINGQDGPVEFDWTPWPIAPANAANLHLCTARHRLGEQVSRPENAYTFFGIADSVEYRGAAPTPSLDRIGCFMKLWRDGPYLIDAGRLHTDCRTVAFLVWRDSDGGKYIAEVNLDGLNRNVDPVWPADWNTEPFFVSRAGYTHSQGDFAGYVIFGGRGVGKLAVPEWPTPITYSLPWCEYLKAAKDAGRLRAPLDPASEIIQIGVGLEARGEVQCRLLVGQFEVIVIP